ncbi:helix-turn-helix domain-containing protein [Chelatococcus albus]|uniref:MarR family transcriptional regulator n=1 Tax=Chelatococcus albus TaxID=3047466 RepID=UPI0030ECC5B5
MVYDALLELWRAPDRRLRQVDLERAMLVRQYGISRLVDRLERDGLVRREPCSEAQRRGGRSACRPPDASLWRLMSPPGGACPKTYRPLNQL